MRAYRWGGIASPRSRPAAAQLSRRSLAKAEARSLHVFPTIVKKPLLPFSYFIALRYLKPKRTFLSVITLISIIGVVLGISVLIIVISVMTGFERELERKMIGFEAHITISHEPNALLSN